jgi:hypothetical protein
MAAMQRMDDIFGYMPFDHYLVVRLTLIIFLGESSDIVKKKLIRAKDKWNPRSSLEQETQEKHLVKTWISLGRNGRSVRSLDSIDNYCDISPLTHFPKRLTSEDAGKTGKLRSLVIFPQI